jgi:hypothetical protein
MKRIDANRHPGIGTGDKAVFPAGKENEGRQRKDVSKGLLHAGSKIGISGGKRNSLKKHRGCFHPDFWMKTPGSLRERRR